MANEVRITIGADTKDADKAVKSFKDKLKDISGKAKGAGIALSAMGAGGVVAIKGFADAALVQQKAVDALTTTMANAGESFADVEDKVMSTTAALQKKTNFGDEAQIAALSQLIPVLGSTELALAALPAVMDVAALQGTDLLSTVKTMGPALGGLTNRVRGTALEFDKADDPMTRINKVLDQLGGTAESQANPFTQMGNAIGDVKEQIGAQLLPLITPLIAGLQKFAEKIQTLNPQVVKIAALVLAGATAFGLIGGPILLLIGFLPALATGFALLSAAMGPITLVVLGIAAAVAAAIVIWKNWSNIIGFFRGVLDTVKETFVSFGEKIAAIGQLYNTNWSWILPGGALMNAIQLIVKHFRDDFIAVIERLQEVAQRVGEALSETFTNIALKIGDVVETIGTKINKFLDGVIKTIKKLIDIWKESPLGKIAGGVAGAVGGMFGSVSDWLGQEKGMAEGGIVPGPMGAPRMILAHGGEMVLNRQQQAAVSNNSITVNVNGNVDDPYLMARLISEQVNTALGEQSIRNEALRSR
jgi:tetrahydromethanopterin S-methyltransferase subunit G